MGVVDRPLVITLALDPVAQQRFDGERAALFPAGRTAVGAHVTLFHAVPGQLEPTVRADLAEVCARAPFTVAVTEVTALGRGAGYRLRAAGLDDVHAQLRRRWQADLTAQDRQGFRPHVTVQNKADVETARRTVAQLRAAFHPFEVGAIGLDLWRYDGGPWTPLASVPFTLSRRAGPEPTVPASD